MKLSPTDRVLRRAPLDLCCDDCGEDLTPSYDPGEKAPAKASWLWWSQPWDPNGGTGERLPVDRVGVRCHRCHSKLNKLDNGRGRSLSDGYLEWFGGLRALPRMFALLRDYQWTPEARDRLCDLFIKLQLLPTSGQDLSWMV